MSWSNRLIFYHFLFLPLYVYPRSYPFHVTKYHPSFSKQSIKAADSNPRSLSSRSVEPSIWRTPPPSPWIDPETVLPEIRPRSLPLDGRSGLEERRGRRRRRRAKGSRTPSKTRRGGHHVCRSLREEVIFHLRGAPPQHPSAGLQEGPLRLLPDRLPPRLAVSGLPLFRPLRR